MTQPVNQPTPQGAQQPKDSVVTYSALGGLIHVDHPVVDTTLCGDGLEGEGGVHNMSMPCEPQRIRCERCVLLIEYAATIPRKFYLQRKRPVRRTR